jgi:hypothetical protein
MAADEGHTLLSQPMLEAQAAMLLGVEPTCLAGPLSALTTTNDVVTAEADGQTEHLVALAPFARAESGLASRLLTLAGTNGGFGDCDLGVFNGDLATVQSIDTVEQELHLVMDDGREVRYPFANLFALTHAYAISVHKAQGAEFPAVVLPLLTSHAMMLGRTLLYTELTRARQLVVLVGQKKALGLAVRDWRRTPRPTALGGLLAGTLRFNWKHQGSDSSSVVDEDVWEGLLASEG